MVYTRNVKFGMVVATDKRCKKIMLNKQWLPWFKVSKFTKYYLTLTSCIFGTKRDFMIL